MAQFDYVRATKYFLLFDFIKGFGLGMKYFFRAEGHAELPTRKGLFVTSFSR